MKAIYDGIDKKLKLFDEGGAEVFLCEARNDTVSRKAWRYPDAGCPPGTFTLNAPEADNPGHEQTEMGPYFIPLTNIPGHVGIGIHGGGSCVAPNSMAPRQGWCSTENCIRVQNADLLDFVRLISGKTPFPIEVVQST